MLEQTTYTQWIGSTLGEYRLTRLVSAGPLGPLFAADSITSSATFLIRVLTVPPAQTPEAMHTYQAYLERQAGHVINLRHPYMLPLVNYGIYQGLPYLVWPYTTMRSLTTRLTQSGVLDVVTMGRYLDQIAAALEYAHQNSTYHRNLSLDCIYLQMDGQIAVADFGVRRLYELLTPGGQSGFFYGSLEALAPEQLAGGQTGAYTDVYALGAVTYRLLTGHTVFSDESFRALAEQHLHAPPPSLAQARAGLPVRLDRVLANALAKDPAQRIQHPGAFADAYHQVIAPDNTRRVPFDSPAGAFGAASGPSQPALAQRPQASRPASQPYAGGATPAGRFGGAAAGQGVAPADGDAPASTQGARQFFARGWWFFLIVLVLVPLVSAGVFFLGNNRPSSAATPPAPSGTLFFVDTSTPPDGSTDGLRLTARGLADPASGAHYEAWLVNQETEQILVLGRLTRGADKTYQLLYSPRTPNGKPAVNVLAAGDMVEITEERSEVVAPAGQPVLLVKFPPKAFIHIGHLLLAYPTTPGKIGLLVGALRQTQALDTQAGALQKAASSGQTALVQCLAQSIIDIDEGAKGEHYQPLSLACQTLGVNEAGDGFGLLDSTNDESGYISETKGTGYIKNAADHAALAVNTPDATDAIRQYSGKVQIALASVAKSLAAANTAALTLLKAPTDSAALAALVAAGGAAYQGQGGAGTGGVVEAYQQGQQMATLSLAPSAS